MNFNLISNEQDNGHEYTVRFSTPVEIKPNSTCTMNFANMTRNSKIILEEDGKATLTINKVYPSVYPNDRATPNNPLVLNPTTSTDFTNTFEIPKGVYSYNSFRALFNDNLNKLVDGTHAAFYRANNNAEDASLPDNDITIGYSLGNKYGNTSSTTLNFSDVVTQGFDAANNFQAVQVDALTGSPVAYTSNSVAAAKSYDSYALSKNHYFHYAFSTGAGQVNSQLSDTQQNLVLCRGINTVQAMAGAITVGLYSPEYALMSGGANRIGGLATPRNIPITPSNVSKLACLVGIECVESSRGGAGNASTMRVNWAMSSIDGTLQTCKAWGNINQTISSMKSHRIGNMNDLFGADNQPFFAWQLYLDETEQIYKTEPRLYLRIYKIGLDSNEVIYDSKLYNEFIPNSFFNADVAFYDDANKVNSQIPFSIIMASQIGGDGWAALEYAALDKSVNNSDSNKPATIIDNYTLSFSKELEDVFLSLDTTPLYPNHTFQRSDLLFNRNMALEWRKKNYSIMLQQLPLDNMKNVSEKRQAGYFKNILGNIPTPFGISNILVEPQGNDAELTSTYQPYNPIISKLNNQKTVLNHMTIRIVDMETEDLATEIIRSVVNFTINDPEKVAIVEEE